MSNYSSSDDDLFDYDPENESYQPLSNSETSSSDYSELQNDVLKSIKTNLDEVDVSPIHGDKAKFAMAYYAATAKFINVGETQSFIKSSRMVLDTLTNGEFTLLQTYYKYEIKISRKMSFLSIFGNAFTSIENELPEFAKEVLQILNIDITSLYIEACFKTVVNLTQHTLMIDRYLYKQVANKLNLPVKDYLFVNPADMNLQDHNVYLEDFNEDIYTKIYQSLVTPDLLLELSNDLQTNVTLKKNYEE